MAKCERAEQTNCNEVVEAVSKQFPLRSASGQCNIKKTNLSLQGRNNNKLAFTLDGVLTSIECQGLIAAAEKHGFQRAGLGSSRKQTISGHRTGGRLISDDTNLAREV
jgi:hypothetical protein